MKGASASFSPGEAVALLGPSGAGKSTLLHIAGLLERADSGQVLINGIDCAQLSDNEQTGMRRMEVGFVYQFHHLLPEFSALENVVLPQLILGVSRDKAESRAKDLLGSLGLEELITARRSSQAASSSASPLPAPWPTVPRCCSPTSRPAPIRRPPSACSSSPEARVPIGRGRGHCDHTDLVAARMDRTFASWTGASSRKNWLWRGPRSRALPARPS